MSNKGNGGPYSVIGNRGPNGRGPAVAALPPNAAAEGSRATRSRRGANANLNPLRRNHITDNMRPRGNRQTIASLAATIRNRQANVARRMFPTRVAGPQRNPPNEIVVHNPQNHPNTVLNIGPEPINVVVHSTNSRRRKNRKSRKSRR
jgi:hypothetical protein